MFEPMPETLDDENWYLSLVLPEQVDEVAAMMLDDGASYYAIGEALTLHFQTDNDPQENTTVFKLASTDGNSFGVVIVSDNEEVMRRHAPDRWTDVNAVASLFGIPEHEAVDEVINREMLRRGVTDYEVTR